MTLEAGQILDSDYTMIEVTLKNGMDPDPGCIIVPSADGWITGSSGATGRAAMFYAHDEGSGKDTAIARGIVSVNGSGSVKEGYTLAFANGGLVTATNTRADATFGQVLDATDDPVWKVLLP